MFQVDGLWEICVQSLVGAVDADPYLLTKLLLFSIQPAGLFNASE